VLFWALLLSPQQHFAHVAVEEGFRYVYVIPIVSECDVAVEARQLRQSDASADNLALQT